MPQERAWPQHTQSKGMKPLFYSQMIAKLERAPRTTTQNQGPESTKIE